MHPLCARHVEVDTSSLKTSSRTSKSYYVAYFTGDDIGPPGIGPLVKAACDETNIKEYGLRQWDFTAEITADGKEIDANDGIHVGRWHQQIRGKDPVDDWQGILWKDGNRWLVDRKD